MEKKGFNTELPSHIEEELEDLVCDNLFAADTILDLAACSDLVTTVPNVVEKEAH